MPPRVDVGDRAAAGADRVDVDHRDHRLVRPDLRVEQVLHAQPAVLREPDVGRRAADVERDHVVVAGLPAGPDAADDAGHGTRHEQVDRPLDRALGGRDAARRGHQVDARPDAQSRAARPRGGARSDATFGPTYAFRHTVEKRSYSRYCGSTSRGDRQERVGELLAHDLGDPLLVLGVEEREQEADGDGLDAGVS